MPRDLTEKYLHPPLLNGSEVVTHAQSSTFLPRGWRKVARRADAVPVVKDVYGQVYDDLPWARGSPPHRQAREVVTGFGCSLTPA
jgi:hypothetical protein